MRLKTRAVQDGVFKENIRLVIFFPFLFFQFHPKGQVPYTHTTLPLPQPPNPGFLYIITLYFLLWFLGSSLIFGLWGGSVFSYEQNFLTVLSRWFQLNDGSTLHWC